MWAKDEQKGESSETIRSRVALCRNVQIARQGIANAHLGSAEVRKYCKLNTQDNEFLELAVEKLGLSTRAHHKILKIARTLADMEGSNDIKNAHITEALSYRAMDRILKHLTQATAL
jgi:magnesium chelatase family protein